MAGYNNFRVDRNKATKTVGQYNKKANYNKSNDKMTKSDRLMNGINKWVGFYRARPDVFVRDYLGIELKPFQRVLLCMMMYNNYTLWWGSRGLGKSFIVSLYCVVRCILYPGSKIIVASKTKEQAMNIVSEKITELMTLSKTGMIEREIDGSIKTNMNSPDPNVEFLNGSWIKVVPANQNARSKRGNVLVLDEFVQISPDIYKNVLRRFLAVSRQPMFMSKSEYKNDKKYMERNQELFLSSCYYKFNWGYKRHKTFKAAMTDGRRYSICAFPYQVAIKEGLVNPDQLMDELREDDIDEIGWHMEMNTLFYGESQSAFFKTEELNRIRHVKKPVYPKDIFLNIKDKKFKYVEKAKDEIRVLSCDISMIGDKANDASIYSLMQITPLTRTINGESVLIGYKRKFSYMESYLGGHSETQAIRIRQLFEDLDCDYIVIDRQGNGISVYDNLCKNLYDAERDVEYKAFRSMNEDKMKERCLTSDAEEKIFTISATQELNSTIALNFKDNMKKNKIDLLIGKNESSEILNKIKAFDSLPMEVQTRFMSPFKQYDITINEMVLLEGEMKDNGNLVLREKRSERKDRYTSVSYASYFADVLEKDLNKQEKGYSIEDYFITGMRL